MPKYLAIVCLVFSQALLAQDVRLFVANEHTKPITVIKEDGKKYRLSPGQTITAHFRIGSTVKNYVDNQEVCTWYVAGDTARMEGLVYGWVGSHASYLSCSILYSG